MRKLYGKTDGSGRFEKAPGILELDGYIIVNPLEVHYRRAGYKPVECSEGVGEAVYTDVGDKIIQTWSGLPEDEYEDHITSLEMAVCEIYELIERLVNDGENLL